MGYLSNAKTNLKALTGSTGVLEAIHSRQWSPYYPLGGTNLRTDRINSVYVAMQSATYGWMYRQTPGVRMVVDYLAAQVSQLGLKLYERVDDDDRQQKGEHPAARALRRPNPFTGGRKFVRTLVTDFLTYDNAYALKLRSDGGPLTLVSISPSIVGLVGQSHFQVEGYQILLQDGSKLVVPPEDMFHWRGENPEDPRRGESKLETLREEIAADVAARQANTELHRSGLIMAGWIERPLEAPPITEEGLKRLRESLANQAKASRREYSILEEGMSFKQGAVTPEDAELLAVRRWTDEKIASQFGMKNVPPESDEERRQLYTDVLPDVCGQLAEALSLHILYHEYRLEDHYFEFNLDDKLMGDERIKSLTSAAGAPIMLRDEARSKLNLPALPDGQGQEIIVPGNVAEGGKPTPQTMPIQDPNKPPQDGSHRSGEADKPMAAGSRASFNGGVKDDHWKFKPIENKRILHPRIEAQRKRFRGYEKPFQDAIRGFLSHQERSLKSKGMDAKAVEDARWERNLGKELQKVAEAVVVAEGAKAARRVLGSFDVERTREYIAAASEAKAAEIVQALRKRLASGDPSEVFKEAREVDAPRAAATLAGTYGNFAVKEVAEQNDKTVTWITTSQNSAHPELNGETVRAGETFSNGAHGPPADHPGCQCMLEIGSEVTKSVEPENKALEILSKTLDRVQEMQQRQGEGLLAVAKALSEQNHTVNVAPAETHIHEAAIQTTVEAGKPAEVKFAKGAVQLDAPITVEAAKPAEFKMEKGAIQIDAPPPAEVRFQEGAVQVPVQIEPTEVVIEKGAVESNVNVEAPNVTTPDVKVDARTIKAPGDRKVTFSDGTTAEIKAGEVTFSDGSKAQISESGDKKKYNPNQPRDPGGEHGGEWVDEGGGGVSNVRSTIKVEGDLAKLPSVRDAIAAVEKTHQYPDGAIVTHIKRANLRTNAGGFDPYKQDILVPQKEDPSTALMLHELGHKLDRTLASKNSGGWYASQQKRSEDEAMKAVVGAMRRSDAYKRLGEAPETANQKAYWRSSSELFARAYAQWIAKRAGTPGVSWEEWEYRAGTQWQDEDFVPIAEALDALIQAKGLGV